MKYGIIVCYRKSLSKGDCKSDGKKRRENARNVYECYKSSSNQESNNSLRGSLVVVLLVVAKAPVLKVSRNSVAIAKLSVPAWLALLNLYCLIIHTLEAMMKLEIEYKRDKVSFFFTVQ